MKSYSTSLGLICVLVTVFSFPAPSIAEHTYPTPIIHIVETASSTPGYTNYTVELLNSTAPLNVFEFELLFSESDIHIEATDIVSQLCEERFIIENTLDLEIGRWYVACGTASPQSDQRIVLATFSVSTKVDRASALVFGTATKTYIHDGRGTMLTPHTIGTVYNQPAV